MTSHLKKGIVYTCHVIHKENGCIFRQYIVWRVQNVRKTWMVCWVSQEPLGTIRCAWEQDLLSIYNQVRSLRNHRHNLKAWKVFSWTLQGYQGLGKSLYVSNTSPTSLNVIHVLHSLWKSPKMSLLSFSILALSINFSLIESDLSGNTVWPQASGFQKLAIFGIFD